MKTLLKFAAITALFVLAIKFGSWMFDTFGFAVTFGALGAAYFMFSSFCDSQTAKSKRS